MIGLQWDEHGLNMIELEYRIRHQFLVGFYMVLLQMFPSVLVF